MTPNEGFVGTPNQGGSRRPPTGGFAGTPNRGVRGCPQPEGSRVPSTERFADSSNRRGSRVPLTVKGGGWVEKRAAEARWKATGLQSAGETAEEGAERKDGRGSWVGVLNSP